MGWMDVIHSIGEDARMIVFGFGPWMLTTRAVRGSSILNHDRQSNPFFLFSPPGSRRRFIILLLLANSANQ